jgi:hypothetical protein
VACIASRWACSMFLWRAVNSSMQCMQQLLLEGSVNSHSQAIPKPCDHVNGGQQFFSGQQEWWQGLILTPFCVPSWSPLSTVAHCCVQCCILRCVNQPLIVCQDHPTSAPTHKLRHECSHPLL